MNVGAMMCVCVCVGPEIMSKMAGESESNLRKGQSVQCSRGRFIASAMSTPYSCAVLIVCSHVKTWLLTPVVTFNMFTMSTHGTALKKQVCIN